MKKIILVLMMVFVLVGCEYQDTIGITAEQEIGRIDNYNFENDIPEFENAKQATKWVNNFIKYKNDKEIYNCKDYWQTPEESYILKTGDCEDYALFLMYILKEKFNFETYLILRTPPLSTKLHAIVYIVDLDCYSDPTLDIYSSQNANDNIEKTIENSYAYEESIWLSMYYHNNI